MENNSNGVAWTALIIGIIALVLAWSAFNRAGQDIEEIVEQEIEQMSEELRDEFQKMEDAARQETSDALEAGSEALDSGAEEIRTDEDD